MHRIVSTLALGFFVSLTACGDDDDTDESSGNPTTSDAAGTGSQDGTSGNQGSTGAEPTATDPGSGVTDEDTGSAAGACDLEADDDACSTCVKETCCDQLEACDADESGQCQCFQDCVEVMPGVAGVEACTTECMAEESMIVTSLVMCSAGCIAECL